MITMKKLFFQSIIFTVAFLFSISTGWAASKNCQRRGNEPMAIYLKAEDINEFEVNVGDTVYLESLRQSVVPPYLMIMPFIQLPETLILKESQPLEEDGVHGTVFVLEVTAPGRNELTVGFKDLQYGTVTHEKVLLCISHKL